MKTRYLHEDGMWYSLQYYEELKQFSIYWATDRGKRKGQFINGLFMDRDLLKHVINTVWNNMLKERETFYNKLDDKNISDIEREETIKLLTEYEDLRAYREDLLIRNILTKEQIKHLTNN